MTVPRGDEGEEAEEKRLLDEDEKMVQEKRELLCPRWEGQQETCAKGSAQGQKKDCGSCLS